MQIYNFLHNRKKFIFQKKEVAKSIALLCYPKSSTKQKMDDAECGTLFGSVDEKHFEIED